MLCAAVVAAALFGYRLLFFEHVPFYFNDPYEDLTYGWFVPVFSLYVLWRERGKLRAAAGEPSAWGILFSLPWLFLGFIGARGGQVRFEILGFAGLMIAIAWTFFGGRMAKAVTFPCVFLLFCIPIQSYLNGITVILRMVAVSVSHAALDGLGIGVVRQGTMLAAANGSFAIDVANPCSGLRSLFAMIALTMAYGYFNHPTWPRRLLLLALAVPIAIFGNVVRILTIAVVGSTCDAEFATGFYHDYSGYIVFFVSVSLMLLASGLIAKGAEKCARS